MRLVHAAHPGRDLWLGYCLNLRAPESLAELQADIAEVVLPVRDALCGAAPRAFGVGLYLPAALARALARDPAGTAALRAFLHAERLVPFTFNAFPYGGFQRDGVKREVFRPTWADQERLDYTLDVAAVAAALAPEVGDGHVSISTHPGAFGAWLTDRSLLRRCAEGLGRALAGLAELEARGGPRCVLALEAEPRASAGTSRALAEYLVFAREVAARVLRTEHGRSDDVARAVVARHLGTCLDACHAAVEFEAPDDALRLATFDGPLGKLQVSNALALPRPAERPDAVAALLALDEPRYLHQTTGKLGAELLRVEDLDELRRALEGAESQRWLAAEEWRCHFHVPIDREALDGGLATTRATADSLLALAAAEPERWGTPALHVEVETYTWSVLPGGAVRGAALAAGVERELRHALTRLGVAGWHAPGDSAEKNRAPGGDPR